MATRTLPRADGALSRTLTTLVCQRTRALLNYLFIYLRVFNSNTCTFQLLDKTWSQVSFLLPAGSCLQFLSRIGSSNLTARRFSSSVANPRSRFPQVNLCARKSPSEIICISHPCRIPPRCYNNLIQKRTTRFITRIRSIYHSPSGIMSYYRYDTTQDIYSPEMQDAQATTFLPVV